MGAASDVPVLITALLTSLGMMTSVAAFTYNGDRLRTLIIKVFGKKKRKLFTKRNRRFVVVWSRFGVRGVAFLTPLLLTPIGGAILVNAFGGKKREIMLYMTISAAFWSMILSVFFKYFKDLVF